MIRWANLSKIGYSLVLAAGLLFSPVARADIDYRGMVDRIGALLNDAATLYEKGDAEGAKTKTQQAYFEVFENLEGPIRINVSAKKNAQLEAAFGSLRTMIVHGDPASAVRAKVDSHMSELRAILPTLEKGARLKAEPGAEIATPTPTPIDQKATEPHWVEVVDGIGATLAQAAATYQSGDADGAASLVTKAQFDGYRNTLLETAIRRYVSQKRDGEYNAEFARVISLIREGQPAAMIRASGVALVEDMKSALPGVPLMGEAAKTQQPVAATVPAQDWRAVADRLVAQMERSAELYAAGKVDQSVALVQDSYFDIFEGSGMEDRLGARDATFMSNLEGYFGKVAASMKAGATPGEIDKILSAMSVDLDRAVDMLGNNKQSPATLFLYSLLLITREGLEALLIVAALLAYLAKTGNQDKQRVIHNSVAVALAGSLATAVFVKFAFDATPASREVLEGGTMLVATFVLFLVSYWLISKAEARKWMDYIKGKMDLSISSGSMKALWLTSFLSVYREGAETVLFYQALVLDADTTGKLMIGAGFLVGCLLLGVLYVAMRFGAMKLPIRPFFMITGSLLYLMAFSFAGQGMMELVEGKVFEPTLVPGLPSIASLGIYPYWQTLAPQAVLLVAALFSSVLLMRRRLTARA
ncbi:FTR1 family protein [Telmatospirillum sp.]|uniref:FTR1 family protein n=1 Tax=Telmatospirillum sp. TaxID=2079197 RepID=UPI002843AA80|nr:FTR1 family protein [Telmatospirillum sp.]MDR3435644.1 FTR1 family protein [Telmatospirillum sp.]